MIGFFQPYDYGSVMHYPKNAWSKNGGDTITPKIANVVIGQRSGMSATDIAELNAVYGLVSFFLVLISGHLFQYRENHSLQSYCRL